MKSILTLLFIIGCASLSAQNQVADEILSTWTKHTEMNHLILNYIQETNLKDVTDTSSRNIGDQFAHMLNVRLMWLQSSPGVDKLDNEIDSKESQNKDYLMSQLKASDEFVGRILKEAHETDSHIGKMSAIRFMSYLISHESHTRGQIVLALKNSGHPLPPNIGYGIWSW